MKNFIKLHLKAIICYTLLIGLLIASLVTGIVSYINLGKHDATVLTSKEFLTKIENKEDFNFVIGSHTCKSCKEFNKTINKYVKEGNKLYYVYLDNQEDDDYYKMVEFIKKETKKLPSDRLFINDVISTPSTFVVRKGEFKDGIVGAIGMVNNTDYKFFKDTLNGDYIGKKL